MTVEEPDMSNKRFEGKVALITGGASGIGFAMAERFGSEGARVALLDRDAGALARAEANLKGMGIDVLGIRCDVTNARSSAAAVKKAIKRFGGIDVLAANAGITQRSLCADTSPEVYRRVMDVNFFGAVNCTLPALPSLITRKGVIVVTTSVAGVAPLYGRTGYAASKHALHGFYESLRTELAEHGVRILMLCPGFTSTNLQKSALDGKGRLNTGDRSVPGGEDSPAHVAAAVSDAVASGKRMLVLTTTGKLSYLIARLIPALYDRLMTKKIRPEFMPGPRGA
ncbi:MAG: SDR family oxidoreductase [Spirochaetes bacterium]|nr:MAG: SDR family oxidoreductase [Spirochaetota bacterium]